MFDKLLGALGITPTAPDDGNDYREFLDTGVPECTHAGRCGRECPGYENPTTTRKA